MRAGSMVRPVIVAATLAGAVALVPGVASAATTAHPVVAVGASATVNPLGVGLGASVGSLLGVGLGASVNPLGVGLGVSVGSLLGVGAGVTASGGSLTVPLDVTVPGPIGGSQTCVSTLPRCIDVEGLENLEVKATVHVSGLGAPLITPATSSACHSPINTGVTITPSALGSADVTLAISYTPVSPTGVPGTPVTDTPINIPLAAGGAPVTITECA
jgi:hypothetical protein